MRLLSLEIGKGQLREGKGLLEITQLRARTGWNFTSSPARYRGAWRPLKIGAGGWGVEISPRHTQAIGNVGMDLGWVILFLPPGSSVIQVGGGEHCFSRLATWFPLSTSPLPQSSPNHSSCHLTERRGETNEGSLSTRQERRLDPRAKEEGDSHLPHLELFFLPYLPIYIPSPSPS